MTEQKIKEIIEKTLEEKLDEAIGKAVKKHIEKEVNGKVNKLTSTVEEHLSQIRPFLDGWRGAMILGKAIKYIAGVLAAIGLIVLYFKKVF